MSLGQVALEYIVCAAVWADSLAGLHYVEKDARVLVPQRCVGRRAVQGQIVCGNFDDGHVGHDDLPVSWVSGMR